MIPRLPWPEPREEPMSHKVRIHLSVFLSLFALWGALGTGNIYLYLCAALAGYGALCFAFSYALTRFDTQQGGNK